MDESEKLAELRKKFFDKYSDSPRFEKFDTRDVSRIKTDDLYALSFVHWKKNVVDDAVEMAANVLEWRKENKINELSVDGIGQKFFQLGSCYIHGRDLNGKRIMTIVGRMQASEPKDQVRRLIMFWLERLQRTEPGQHVTCILDVGGTSVRQTDMGMIRFIIDAFVTYFPDLLEKMIILDLPRLMNAICNLVMKMLSEEQRKATVFCSKKDLSKYVSPDQLPAEMGGTDPWKYTFPPFPDDLIQVEDFAKIADTEYSKEKDSSSKATTDVGYASGSDKSPEKGDASELATTKLEELDIKS